MEKIFSAAVVVLLVIWVSCSPRNKESEVGQKDVPEAPALLQFNEVVSTLESSLESFSLSDRKSDTVLVDFWATWCRPCINEINNIQKGEIVIPSHVDFRAVSIDENLDDWRSFLEAKKPNWPQFHLKDASVLDKLNVQFIPHKILLNFSDSSMVLDFPAEAISGL